MSAKHLWLILASLAAGAWAVAANAQSTVHLYIYDTHTGTVTQATNKATGVTLNKVTGLITMNNAALAADTTVTFTLTDSAIAATDTITLQHNSGGTVGAYTITAQPAAGSATISVRNITAGSLSEAIVIRFTVIKSISA